MTVHCRFPSGPIMMMTFHSSALLLDVFSMERKYQIQVIGHEAELSTCIK